MRILQSFYNFCNHFDLSDYKKVPKKNSENFTQIFKKF